MLQAFPKPTPKTQCPVPALVRLSTVMRHTRFVVLSVLLASGCASAPPARPAAAPVVAADQKMSWILRLENTRMLRDPAPPPPAVVAPPPGKSKGKTAAPVPAVPIVADLATLAADTDARIRRRAALAIGRVGLAEGAAAVK